MRRTWSRAPSRAVGFLLFELGADDDMNAVARFFVRAVAVAAVGLSTGWGIAGSLQSIPAAVGLGMVIGAAGLVALLVWHAAAERTGETTRRD